jgi:hypothetical protein
LKLAHGHARTYYVLWNSGTIGELHCAGFAVGMSAEGRMIGPSASADAGSDGGDRDAAATGGVGVGTEAIAPVVSS